MKYTNKDDNHQRLADKIVEKTKAQYIVGVEMAEYAVAYSRERAIMAFRYACSCGRNAGNDYPCPDYLDCNRYKVFADRYDGIIDTCGSCQHFDYEDILGIGECNRTMRAVHCGETGCRKFKPKGER